MKPKPIKETIIDKMGPQMVKDNPFISSEEFIMIIKATAAMPKIILMATSGPGEAINGLMSVVVTFLKNIPDGVWNTLMKIAAQHAEEKPDLPTMGMMEHLDALRNYTGKNYVQQEYATGDESDDTPQINAPMPKMPS